MMFYTSEKCEFQRWHRVCRLHTLDVRRVSTPRLVNTGCLVLVRAVLLLYTLTVWIATIVYDVQTGVMSGHFAYFTYLCYTGLVAYMASSLIHTVLFWRRSTHVSFQNMPRTLQLFHWLLFESVVVFAMLVTPVFWAVLYSADKYVGGEHRWLNASVHAANLGCILVDVVAGSMVLSPHWIHPAILAFVVVLYLALAYLNKAINGWFTYNFIDYTRHHWMVLVFAIGILAAIVLVYYIIYALQLLLDRFLPPKVSLSSPLPLSSDSDDDGEFKA